MSSSLSMLAASGASNSASVLDSNSISLAASKMSDDVIVGTPAPHLRSSTTTGIPPFQQGKLILLLIRIAVLSAYVSSVQNEMSLVKRIKY